MFETELIKERMNRAYNALTEFDVDLWLSIGRETSFTTEPALLYLLPATGLSQVALAVGKKESICVIGALDAEEAETYGAHSETVVAAIDFEEKLTATIKRFGSMNRVALNFSEVDPSADGLSLTQYKRLMRCLKDAGFSGEVISSANIMKRVRGQKGVRELDGIKTSIQAAMSIFERSRDFIRSGLTGFEIQQFFQDQVHEIGAEYSWPRQGNPYVSVGNRSSYLCKRPPDDVFLRPGDLVNVDFGLRIDGFASDNQRSYYVLGEDEETVPDEIRNAFFAVQEAIRAAISVAGPGVHTTIPLKAANAVFESRGYPKVRSLGHELGTYAHEGGMRIGYAFDGGELDMQLEEGMVFTMEPAIITSHGRLCQEEVVAITGNGCRLLSTPQKDVWLV